VKFSSWPDAQNPAYLNDTVRAFDAIGGALVADAAPGERQGVAGVVSGLRRQGVTSATPASSGHSGAI
jgi:hypothetical protein